MDFLNQAAGQLRELMLSMTPAARVTALLLLGVIGVSLGYLVQHQSAGPDSYLFNGEFMPPRVISRAEAAIAQAGLTGYEVVGNRIKVPNGRKTEFLAAVADGGALPPNFHQLMDDAIKLGPFASGDTRRQATKAAREQQLSLMIGKMAGIEEADVVFDILPAKGLARKGTATASVSVLPAAGESLESRRVKMIKKAVAGAIAELGPDQVVVTNIGDGTLYDSDSEITSDSFENDYYQTRLAFEKDMQSKIIALLHDVPGARVQVTAELDATLEHTTQSMTPEDEPAALRTTQQIETDKISEVDNGGQPGLAAQGPRRASDESPTVTVKNDRSVESNQADNFVGTKREFTRGAALVPKSVRAAIAVPTSYLLSVWREKERKLGKDPDQDLPNDIDEILSTIKIGVITQIKDSVIPLLPKELAKENLSDVGVTFFESLTPDPVEGPSTATQLLGWAQENFSTMTMAGVALVGLVMLRSMVKSIPAVEPIAAIAGTTLSLDTSEGSGAAPVEGEAADDAEGGRPRLRLKKGDSLKDDLVEIVREDPDAAAAILRSWIGNAG